MATVIDLADLGATAWDGAVRQHPHGWFFHTSAWLAYARAYTPESRDASFAVRQRGVIDAVVPLVVVSPTGGLVHGGQITPSPLTRTAEAASVAYEEAERRLGAPPGPLILRPGVRPPSHAADVPEGWRYDERRTLVLDLRAAEADLWRGVRRSYHALIHKAERQYAVGVYGPQKLWVIAAARQLHIAAAGRETRSVTTWDLMGHWMNDGRGLVALATDEATGEHLGFAYALRDKFWSYYASGATARPNIMHALQWALIKALRCDGRTRFYELGHEAEPGADEKAQGIAHFKAGWGGRKWPVGVLSPIHSDHRRL